MSELNTELADFLRRARNSADRGRAGLPMDGRIRRVPGLRREEVAMLAGLSTDYYTRLEQGRRISPSGAVLDAIARALDFSEAQRAHLGHLVSASTRVRPSAAPTRAQRVRPGLHQLLEALTGEPALILGRHTDILATNRLARLLFADFDRLRPRDRNFARWVFLADQARDLFLDWEVQARVTAETLRLDFGRYPDDPRAHELIRELKDHSVDFPRWWTEHRVTRPTFGSLRLQHPMVGELSINYETLLPPGDAEQTLFIFTAEARTPSRDALSALARSAYYSGSERSAASVHRE